MAKLKQYKRGSQYYGYDPMSGEGIAFADQNAFSKHFGAFDENAPDLPVDSAVFDKSANTLVKGERDYTDIARQAGAAGMGLSDLQTLIGSGTGGDLDQIRKGYGIDALEQRVFKGAPSTEKLFTEAYATAGLADLKKRIDALTSERRTVKDQLNERLSKVNENPWLSEASRLKSVGNTKDFFDGTLSGLSEEEQSLVSLFNSGLAQVNDLVSRKSTDFANQQAIDQAQLNYLISKADQEVERRKAAEAGKLGRYLPEYLTSKTRASKPETLETDDGSVYQWDPNTGAFVQLYQGTKNDTKTELGELLSPEEAMKLGVRYGTTKGEAANAGITPQGASSAEMQKLKANASAGVSALATIKNELFGAGSSTKSIDELNNVRSNVLFRRGIGMAKSYEFAVNAAKDAIARIKSGAAITKNEEELFEKFIPQLTENEATIKNKLRSMETFFNSLGASEGGTPASGGADDLFQQFEQSNVIGPTRPGSTSVRPPSNSRTDRHFNPTAFTTDVAKTAGLREGVDYVAGDAFPNNPKLRTAKLLRDPVQTTIQVLDKIGFYTQSGKQRWTHTAIPQAQWNKMTRDQKMVVVEQMYKKENGGKSSLSNFYT